MADEVDPKPQVGEPEPKKVEAQDVVPEEPFDKDRAMNTIHALRAVEKAAKAEHAELEALKAEKAKRAEAEMTEAQKLQKQAEDAKAEAAQLKLDLLRRDVVAESGIPAIFADRLQGATKEEMLADAEKLKAALPQPTKQAPHLNATNPSQATTKETDAEQRERLFGRQGGAFDLDVIKAQGGGVVWKK
jgi:hypothetical protein